MRASLTAIVLPATASNALTFGLMVLTAFLTSTITRYIGVRWTLFFGGSGYAVYAGKFTSLTSPSARTNLNFLKQQPVSIATIDLATNGSFFWELLSVVLGKLVSHRIILATVTDGQSIVSTVLELSDES
jgi:hypothetical protein